MLCGLWQDSAQVLVMSTIHDLQTGTSRLRQRPEENQLNSKITRAIFGDDVRKLLTIPDLIDDHNNHMNGVDIADQLRASYHTHLSGVHNWLPLFYWLVDTLKVNSYLIWRMHYPRASYKLFQLTLPEQLIAEGLEQHQAEVRAPMPINSIPGLPPSLIIAGSATYKVNNILYCLTYIFFFKTKSTGPSLCCL